MKTEILRFPALKGMTGLSRTTFWRLERDVLFPARRNLSANIVGWIRAEVEEWLESRSPVSISKGEKR